MAVAREGDEVLLRLESGGGMVHGYGLASSQLDRIKAAGLPLTISVDKVAASGGYMMACVADKIVSAPFAIFSLFFRHKNLIVLAIIIRSLF